MGVAEGVGGGEGSFIRGGIGVDDEAGDRGRYGSGEERGGGESGPLERSGAGDGGRDGSGEESGERENRPEVLYSAV